MNKKKTKKPVAKTTKTKAKTTRPAVKAEATSAKKTTKKPADGGPAFQPKIAVVVIGAVLVVALLVGLFTRSDSDEETPDQPVVSEEITMDQLANVDCSQATMSFETDTIDGFEKGGQTLIVGERAETQLSHSATGANLYVQNHRLDVGVATEAKMRLENNRDIVIAEKRNQVDSWRLVEQVSADADQGSQTQIYFFAGPTKYGCFSGTVSAPRTEDGSSYTELDETTLIEALDAFLMATSVVGTSN